MALSELGRDGIGDMEVKGGDVIVIDDVSEHLGASAELIEEGPPDELERLVLDALSTFFWVNVEDVEALEACLCQEARVSQSVARATERESGARHIAEVVPQEPVTDLEAQEHVVIGRAGLVVHLPHAIGDLELPV